MRLQRHTREHKCSISMASLIDVVFLLIIFFMTVSHINATEDRPLELPRAQSSDNPAEQDSSAITVNIEDDGDVYIAGQILNDDELAAKIKEIGSLRNVIGQPLILRVSRETPWQKVRPVMEICKDAGLCDVKVRVVKKSD